MKRRVVCVSLMLFVASACGESREGKPITKVEAPSAEKKSVTSSPSVL